MSDTSGPNLAPQAARLLKTLRSVLSDAAKPIDVLRSILTQAVERTEADRGIFVEVDREGAFEYRVIHRFEPGELEGRQEFSRTVFHEVARSGKPLSVPHAAEDPNLSGRASVLDLGLVSLLCAPILVGGRVRALVHVESRGVGHFTDEHFALLQSLAELAGPVLETMQEGNRLLRERRRLRESEQRLSEEVEGARESMTRDWNFGRFVGRSPAVRELEAQVVKAARTDYPVLLLGETGTGKSIVARVIHHGSPRAKTPFVTVFCPALEKSMVEAELFGHRKGAFTGATADREGKVQLASGGTLFLDEIGELPPDIQAKLLRLLQEKTYEVVGDPRERTSDVRVIAATNRDLEREVDRGTFRRDLYERLNFLPVRIPPLRERRSDIPRLLRHCLDRTEAGRWIELDREAEEHLARLDSTWPGNVREVEQLAARMAVDAPEGPVGRDDIDRMLSRTGGGNVPPRADRPNPASGTTDFDAGLKALLRSAERELLREALETHPDLDRTALAAKLKISESSLYKKLKDYGLGS